MTVNRFDAFRELLFNWYDISNSVIFGNDIYHIYFNYEILCKNISYNVDRAIHNLIILTCAKSGSNLDYVIKKNEKEIIDTIKYINSFIVVYGNFYYNWSTRIIDTSMLRIITKIISKFNRIFKEHVDDLISLMAKRPFKIAPYILDSYSQNRVKVDKLVEYMRYILDHVSDYEKYCKKIPNIQQQWFQLMCKLLEAYYDNVINFLDEKSPVETLYYHPDENVIKYTKLRETLLLLYTVYNFILSRLGYYEPKNKNIYYLIKSYCTDFFIDKLLPMWKLVILKHGIPNLYYVGYNWEFYDDAIRYSVIKSLNASPFTRDFIELFFYKNKIFRNEINNLLTKIAIDKTTCNNPEKFGLQELMSFIIGCRFIEYNLDCLHIMDEIINIFRKYRDEIKNDKK